MNHNRPLGLPVFRLFSAVILCLSALSVSAATSSGGIASLVEQLQLHYQKTDSFTADFVETLSSPGGQPRERKGTVAYRRSGMIRWEFKDPQQPETIVADGTTLFDYDPGLNQVMEMPLASAFKTRSAAAFILGVGNLQRDFKVTVMPSAPDDGLKHLLVIPKDGGDKIELGVDTTTLNIMSLHIVDALGNATELKFSAIQRNVPLESSQFKFTPPAGADIVKSGPPSGS